MMDEKSTALAEQKVGWGEVITEKLDLVADGLPKEFNKTRFVQNAIALINGNETLSEWNQKHGGKQILAGLMRGAFLNLDFLSNEAYLVPYKGKLQFQPSYRGAVKLAQKYSIRPIKNIFAEVVRKGDEFEQKIIGGKPSIDFKPLPFNDGDVVGAFAICEFQDGGYQNEVMSYKELEKVRSKSLMGHKGAWEDYTSEMYKKVVLNRLCKHIQIDFENTEQLRYWNESIENEFSTGRDKDTDKGASLNAVLLEDDSEGEVVSEQ